MNAFTESASESDIRHSQSQHESDPNQYQYPHSVIEQSGTSEQYIAYTHHQYIVKQYATKCHQYHLQLNQYSQQTQHLKAQNSAIPPTVTIHVQSTSCNGCKLRIKCCRNIVSK
eukprot:779748_1